MQDPKSFPDEKLNDVLEIYKSLVGQPEYEKFFKDMSDSELQKSLEMATKYYNDDNKKVEKEIEDQEKHINHERNLV